LAGLATIHKASDGRKPLVVIGSLALALLIAVSLSLSGKANRGLYAPSTPDGRQLFYEDRILETLSVLKDRLGYKTLYRQGAPSASTRPMDIACQKLLVHMPMLLRDRAERVLLLGFGNGASAYSILQHDRVREVDVAVRNLSVLKAAVYQTEANQGLLKQPDDRLKIVQGDLHDLLDQAESVFDLIAVDFTDLRQQGQARQFATPFLQTCRKLLGEEGMIAVWLPLEGLNADMVKIALATFDDVFPETTVFYITSEPTQRLLLIGQMVPWTIDFRQCERNLSESDVRDDLAEYFLDDLDKLLSFYLIGGQALDEYVADVRVNDTEWPLLEFLTPVNVNAKPLDGLDSLLENSRSVEGLISPESIPSRELERLRMLEKARPLLIEGHRQYLQDDLEAATQSYLAALQITPGDLSLRQNLLGFPMIQQWILAAPEDPGPCILLGRVFMLQPDKSRASLELFGQAEARILKGLEAGTVSDDLGQKQLADIRIWMQELRTNIDLEDRRWP
jgi:spermidine synthase